MFLGSFYKLRHVVLSVPTIPLEVQHGAALFHQSWWPRAPRGPCPGKGRGGEGQETKILDFICILLCWLFTIMNYFRFFILTRIFQFILRQDSMLIFWNYASILEDKKSWSKLSYIGKSCVSFIFDNSP